ncbi:MAG TPA: NAD-dependent protein deacetylase [Gammaproteobacteria bacterium]
MATAALREFTERHAKLFVLTGAGCSTESGIPDYRDADGEWKRGRPITLQEFVSNERSRQRYWARSLIGFRRMRAARPNDAHRALAALESQGRLTQLVTQNVDGLHQAAGSRNVVDLHGRVDFVRCLTCDRRTTREQVQTTLVDRNPAFAALDALEAPDGDALLDGIDFAGFEVPACGACGGLLKPDVVFFGERVPEERVQRAFAALAEADAMLVVGSSLMVFSGYRFARAAAQAGKPIAAVNLGRTRADDLLTLKIVERCAHALAFLDSEETLRAVRR